MTEGRLARWSPVSGIVFVAFFIVGSVIFDEIPSLDASDSQILAYYGDGGKQVRVEIAYFLLTLGGVLFLWFAGALAARLREAEGAPGWLSRTALVSGGAYTVLILIGFALGEMALDIGNDSSVFQLDPDTVRLLNDASYTLVFETALPVAAPLVLAATVVFLRTALLPRGWAGPAWSSRLAASSGSSP